MVEIRDFKTVDVKMQAMNDGDILTTCIIIWYMGHWWKCFDNASKQPATKKMYKYGGCS
jgi:hypothetical protein